MINIVKVICGMLVTWIMHTYRKKIIKFLKGKEFAVLFVIMIIISISYKFHDEKEKQESVQSEEKSRIEIKQKNKKNNLLIENFLEKKRIEAENGNIEAIFDIVDFYPEFYLDEIPEEDLYWLKEASKKGSIKAVLLIAYHYRYLVTMNRESTDYDYNFEQYIFWCTQAAKNGHVQSQRSLALLYRGSDGGSMELFNFKKIPRDKLDIDKAIYWHTQAARNGDYRSTWDLYVIHVDGIEIKKNYQAAYEWLSLLKIQLGQRFTRKLEQELEDLKTKRYHKLRRHFYRPFY